MKQVEVWKGVSRSHGIYPIDIEYVSYIVRKIRVIQSAASYASSQLKAVRLTDSRQGANTTGTWRTHLLTLLLYPDTLRDCLHLHQHMWLAIRLERL